MGGSSCWNPNSTTHDLGRLWLRRCHLEYANTPLEGKKMPGFCYWNTFLCLTCRCCPHYSCCCYSSSSSSSSSSCCCCCCCCQILWGKEKHVEITRVILILKAPPLFSRRLPSVRPRPKRARTAATGAARTCSRWSAWESVFGASIMSTKPKRSFTFQQRNGENKKTAEHQYRGIIKFHLKNCSARCVQKQAYIDSSWSIGQLVLNQNSPQLWSLATWWLLMMFSFSFSLLIQHHWNRIQVFEEFHDIKEQNLHDIQPANQASGLTHQSQISLLHQGLRPGSTASKWPKRLDSLRRAYQKHSLEKPTHGIRKWFPLSSLSIPNGFRWLRRWDAILGECFCMMLKWTHLSTHWWLPQLSQKYSPIVWTTGTYNREEKVYNLHIFLS